MEHRQEIFAPPVHHLVEDLPVASFDIRRPQDIELRFILDEATAITRRLFQVDDDAIQRMVWVQLPVRRSRNAEVTPRRSKFLPIDKWFHTVDLQVNQHIAPLSDSSVNIPSYPASRVRTLFSWAAMPLP
jgi:hypothetical protein